MLQTLKNTAANLALAALVFFAALQVEQMLGVVKSVDANANGVVELVELAAYYGVASAPGPACKPPLRLLGIAIGGPRC